jgi:hypothetical protein
MVVHVTPTWWKQAERWMMARQRMTVVVDAVVPRYRIKRPRWPLLFFLINS